MAAQLPTKLGKEPLIDVVFGVTFDSDSPAESLLPGILLPALSEYAPRLESLPFSQVPQALRGAVPNLHNAPSFRVVLGTKFTVLIGSKWIGIGCQMPYSGWKEYRTVIERVCNSLRGAAFIKTIQRHSLKYVDFIKSTSEAPASLDRFNLQIEVAGHKLSTQITQLRTEINEHPFVHATTVMTPATATPPGQTPTNGSLVDVDTHRVQDFSVEDFLKQLPDLLESIHTANKSFFFALLSERGLNELEPKYD